MKLFESKMAGNVYNKNDAETWGIIPKLSETKVTSYLDVDNLVLVDENVLSSEREVYTETSINHLFDELNLQIKV